MRPCPFICGFSGVLLLLSHAFAAESAELQVMLRHEGKPVADAVVELVDASGVAPSPAAAIMDQIDSEFVPRLLVVPRGSKVSFPNSDSTRHQVYSFSATKRFELPLYSGTPPDPVVFETAGVVTLGCNIHDAMIGFIVVVDSDRWAHSGEDGAVSFATVPAGSYRLKVWHERLAGGQREEVVDVPATGGLQRTVDLELTPPPPPRGSDRLRLLQERLRSRPREPS